MIRWGQESKNNPGDYLKLRGMWKADYNHVTDKDSLIDLGEEKEGRR